VNASSHPRPFLSLPHDRTGWSAVGLFALFLVVSVANTLSGNGLAVLIAMAMLAMVVGLVLSIVAIVRHGERSLLLVPPHLAGTFAVLFVAVELLVGHE
jgi:hypothetical protein